MRALRRAFLVVILVVSGSFPVMGMAATSEGGDVDGFTIGYLPEGVGDLVSDFSTEWEGVAFESRVWEHRTSEGGYRVDLMVNVLRGERLDSVEALRDFMAEYQEQAPDEWDLRPFEVGHWRGYRTEGLAFWLVENGVGVRVRLDHRRFDDHALTRTAYGVRPEDRSHAA